MIRLLFWLVVYIVCLGSVSIKVSYKDGLKINLIGWPEGWANRKKKTSKD